MCSCKIQSYLHYALDDVVGILLRLVYYYEQILRQKL